MTSIRKAGLALLLVLFVVGCSDDVTTITPESAADPLVAGPYPVGITRIEFFDASRNRTILTEVWYPADESARGQDPAPIVYYLPEGLESLGDNATLDLVAVLDAPLSPDGPFPLIAFSHGNGGIRYQNNFQCDHLASHGYVVVAPDHQGNTFFETDSSINHVVERPLDMIYLFDTFSEMTTEPGGPFEGWIDTSVGYGVTGHSFGAYTSIAAALMDDRIAAIMPMAVGSPLGDDFTTPAFFMLAAEDKTIGESGNQGILNSFDQAEGPRFLVEIPDAGHYSFTFACQIGLPGPWNGDGCQTGTRFEDGSEFDFVDDQRVWRMVNGYSAALFGRYLNGVLEYEETLTTNLDPEIADFQADL